jgi:NADPH-dependent 2,4-dienoyl-CoA reductase/sulfur reductase-like enzyme/nitrite reductase/ring-hydroxylating ferredoxin subunit
MAEFAHEHKAARLSDLRDGQMTAVTVEDTKILLARVGNEVHAVNAVCTHYGGPLHEGSLSGRCVTCPWHMARFDVSTGDVLDPPALDGLRRFDVRVEGDEIFVRLPAEVSGERTMPMTGRDTDQDTRIFAIIGAGAAGLAAAETLRQEGFAGRIILISRDPHAPYDRPALSKAYFAGAKQDDDLPLRSRSFLGEHGIERWERTAESIDLASRTILLDGDEQLRPDGVLVATGGRPRRLHVANAHLNNIFTLRTWDDAHAMRAAAADAEHVVIIGSGFIGMELAASLAEFDETSVTVVSRDDVPLEDALGGEIGGVMQRLHERNGTRFRFRRKVARFEGDDWVQQVVLDDDSTLDADMVVLAIGVDPATGLIAHGPRNTDGSLDVDEQLRFAEGFWAAGDIARFYLPCIGQRVRIEHWRTAQQMGRAAARSMLGRDDPFDPVPFFWTRQFGTSFGYVGHADDYDDVILEGAPDDLDFMAFYVLDDQVCAAAGTRSQQLLAFAELMRLGRVPAASDLRGAFAADLAPLLAEQHQHA